MVCWTRWYGRSLCAACVRRGLSARDAIPEQVRAHKRQATLAFVLGLLSWGGLLVGAGMVFAASAGISNRPEPWRAALILVGALLWLPTPFASLFGIGQGAAAVRGRGDRMVVGTVGLVLCGLHMGVVVGIMVAGTIATVRDRWSVGLPEPARAVAALLRIQGSGVSFPFPRAGSPSPFLFASDDDLVTRSGPEAGVHA
jgi:hypothetical protein